MLVLNTAILVQDFSFSVRNLFHIVGPLKPIALRVKFKLKLQVLKLLSENLVGYVWSIIENVCLNALGIILFLALNINKRCCRMLI